MQAVILAGGLGTRLWPITRDIPKPMVEVAGKPYLYYQLELLARQQITDVVLLTGYLGEQIEEYFGDGSALGLSLRYSREPEPIGTGGALRHARSLLAREFLVIYGDSYLPIDYGKVLGRLAEGRALGIIVVFADESGETMVRPNVALNENEFVIRYHKSDAADPELRYIEAGVLGLRREVLDWMPAAAVVSLEREVFPRLIEAGLLAAMPVRQRFYDIGTPERLKAIEEFLR
jgi:NDP-sugar pyrophosphorylase family protein